VTERFEKSASASFNGDFDVLFRILNIGVAAATFKPRYFVLVGLPNSKVTFRSPSKALDRLRYEQPETVYMAASTSWLSRSPKMRVSLSWRPPGPLEDPVHLSVDGNDWPRAQRAFNAMLHALESGLPADNAVVVVTRRRQVATWLNQNQGVVAVVGILIAGLGAALTFFLG